METANRSIEEEVDKVGMVQMTTTCVDPWTMMIHLHNTPRNKRKCFLNKKI